MGVHYYHRILCIGVHRILVARRYKISQWDTIYPRIFCVGMGNILGYFVWGYKISCDTGINFISRDDARKDGLPHPDGLQLFRDARITMPHQPMTLTILTQSVIQQHVSLQRLGTVYPSISMTTRVIDFTSSSKVVVGNGHLNN